MNKNKVVTRAFVLLLVCERTCPLDLTAGFVNRVRMRGEERKVDG